MYLPMNGKMMYDESEYTTLELDKTVLVSGVGRKRVGCVVNKLPD